MLGSRESKERSDSRKPKYSRFTQQELPSSRLLLTPAVVILTLLAVGAVFIPLGVVCLNASNQVVEVVTRYDDACLPFLSNDERNNLTRSGNITSICQLSVTVPQDMNPPVFVYYQLTNFYQNYRRYVRSQSESQLAGSNVTGSGLDVCQPQAYEGGNPALPVVPCGLIAWSFFNDTYNLSVSTTGKPPYVPLPLDSSDISWPSDRNVKFGNVPPQNFNTNETVRGGGTITTNLTYAQDLQVWMRTAALPTFRKLYAQINQPLYAGSLVTLDIRNRYNSYAYGGQKSLVISTATWLGGKNSFLGIAYLTVGSICIFLSVVFFILQFTSYRPLGDTSYLSWNRKAAEAKEPTGPMPVFESSNPGESGDPVLQSSDS